MNKNDQEVYYNQRWNEFEFINSLKLQRSIAILEGIKETKLKEPYICDMGCGAGWLSGMLGLIGPTVGVDLSTSAVEKAHKRHPYVNFIQADILDWDYKGELFNIVVSQEVIEHIEQQENYLDVIYSLLKPGGYLILTTPNKKVFNWWPKEKQVKWTNQPIEKWLTIRELKKFVSSKFKIIKITTIIPGFEDLWSLRWINSNPFQRLLHTLRLWDISNRLRLKFHLGLHIFLLAKKE